MIGPFFYYQGRVIAHTIPDYCGENRADMLDNPYSHQQLLYEAYPMLEYISIPRGRVVFNTRDLCSILYIDRCIENDPNAVDAIMKTFCLGRYQIQHDDHYVCPGCCDFDKLFD